MASLCVNRKGCTSLDALTANLNQAITLAPDCSAAIALTATSVLYRDNIRAIFDHETLASPLPVTQLQEFAA